jgi:hypothetical protein
MLFLALTIISTNREDVYRWMVQNLKLNEGEYLIPFVRGNAHAEINGGMWGIRNGFNVGSFGTSTPGCTTCIQDFVFNFNMLRGASFTHDNPGFGIIEILLNPGFFYP